MKWKRENKLSTIGFFSSLVLIIFLSVFSYLNFKKNNENVKRLRHTYIVLQTSKELLSTIKDAETANRGYILTKNLSFLTPLNNSVSKKDSLLNRISYLCSDNKDQQQKIQKLKSLIKEKYARIYSTLLIRQTKGLDEAIKVINSGKGKKIMDDIRSVFLQFDIEEQKTLEKREIEMQNSIIRSEKILFIGTFSILSIFLIIFFFLTKQIKNRKEYEVRLFIQNKWFTQMLLSLGDGVITTDTNGIITMINKAACQISGWTSEEAVGKNIDFIFNIENGKTGEKVLNPATVALRENKIILLEQDTLLRRKDGSKIYIDDSGAPIHDSEDSIIGAILIFRDISEKKKAEQERDLFYNISIDMIGVAEYDGYFKRVNPAFEKTLGYTEKEFISTSYLEFINPDDIQKTNEEGIKLAAGEPTLNFINRYKCKNGKYKWIEWNVIPIENSIYAIGRDTTERHKVAQEIEAAHKKFYQILESNPVAIVITEIKNKQIKYVNDAFCTMSGFKREMIIGKNASDLKTISTEEGEKIRQKILDAGGREKDIESKFRMINGEVIDVLFSVESIEIDGTMCFIGSFIDITQRKKSEEQIKQLNLTLEKRVKKRTKELQSQKEFTDDILNKIPTEIAVYDQNYLYVNPKGIDNEEIRDWIIGKSDFDYCKLKGIDDAIANKRHESFIKVKENESVEWIDEIKTDKGKIKYMLRILHPLAGNDKYILTGYDITELKNAESEKQQYITDLEQMMFMTSHKVRHPVTVMMGISNLLQEELSKEEFMEIVGYIKEPLLSLDNFTKELTMFIYDLKMKNEKREL